MVSHTQVCNAIRQEMSASAHETHVDARRRNVRMAKRGYQWLIRVELRREMAKIKGTGAYYYPNGKKHLSANLSALPQ